MFAGFSGKNKARSHEAVEVTTGCHISVFKYMMDVTKQDYVVYT